MADLKALYSSKSDEWSTPQDLYDELNKEFGFNLDPCATKENHKCELYYTKEQNGLDKNWGGEEHSAILHIAKLINGLKKHFMKLETIIL